MSSSAMASSTVWLNLRGLLKTMRPHQWTKNAIIFAALVFDGKLGNPQLLGHTLIVALCFCLASSSVYLINDLVDIEAAFGAGAYKTHFTDQDIPELG